MECNVESKSRLQQLLGSHTFIGQVTGQANHLLMPWVPYKFLKMFFLVFNEIMHLNTLAWSIVKPKQCKLLLICFPQVTTCSNTL